MYRGSRIFVLIGLPVAIAAILVLALNADPADSNPKGTLIPIFAVVAVFFLILFFLQTRDLGRARRRSVIPEGSHGLTIDNPMTASEGELWAGLAIRPISDQAIEAQAKGWEMASSSLSAAKLVTALILIAVPATYLLESFVPVLVGAAVIVVVALASSVRMIGAGGGLDQAYEASSVALEPLGLKLVRRPTVRVMPRFGPAEGLKTDIRGGLEYAGTRHGRRVRVAWDGGACEVVVETPGLPAFKAGSSDGRIKPRRRAPSRARTSARLWRRSRTRRAGRT